MASFLSQTTPVTPRAGLASTRNLPNTFVSPSMRQQCPSCGVRASAASVLTGNAAAPMSLGLHGHRTGPTSTFANHTSSESDAEVEDVQTVAAEKQREAAMERRRQRMASWGKAGSFPVVSATLEATKPNNLDF
eukprot:jgi/Ulvmu1/1547/UM110_0010.1